jgi:hypothetical protein
MLTEGIGMEATSFTKQRPSCAEEFHATAAVTPSGDSDQREPAPPSAADASMVPVPMVVKEAVLRRLMRWQA